MVPMPAAGGSALGRYLRFLVLERERDKEIELEREILNVRKGFAFQIERALSKEVRVVTRRGD